MAFTINLGNWGSVFAVPSKVADEKLKLSSAYQLRVLLYVLGHNNMNFTNEEIGKALAMHEEDVKDALTYWVQEGILAFKDDVYTPSDVPVENNSRKEINTPTTLFFANKDKITPIYLGKKIKRKINMQSQNKKMNFV